MLTIEFSDTSKPIYSLPLLRHALRQLNNINIRHVPTGTRTQDMVLRSLQERGGMMESESVRKARRSSMSSLA